MAHDFFVLGLCILVLAGMIWVRVAFKRLGREQIWSVRIGIWVLLAMTAYQSVVTVLHLLR